MIRHLNHHPRRIQPWDHVLTSTTSHQRKTISTSPSSAKGGIVHRQHRPRPVQLVLVSIAPSESDSAAVASPPTDPTLTENRERKYDYPSPIRRRYIPAVPPSCGRCDLDPVQLDAVTNLHACATPTTDAGPTDYIPPVNGSPAIVPWTVASRTGLSDGDPYQRSAARTADGRATAATRTADYLRVSGI